MSYRIAINFEDDVTRFFDCGEDETILDAAYRHKINLPMDCADGVCGTCKGRCENGQYDLGDEYIEDALSDDEAAQGLVLTCQTVPQSDCVIRMPVASHLCKLRPQTVTGTLAEVSALSEDSFELSVDMDAGTHLDFLPGQYVNIDVPGEQTTRSYSFSSRPGTSRGTFLIRNVANGVMSGYLTGRAQAGDALTLTGPMGAFYLRPVERPVLMLAGGTGLAPFLAMLAELAENGCRERIHLLYGVNCDAHLVKCDALDQLTQQLAHFSYDTVVLDDASAHPRKGYVTHHLSADMLEQGDIDIYVCGPPPMVEAVEAHIDHLGVEPHGLYAEKFLPRTAQEDAA